MDISHRPHSLHKFSAGEAEVEVFASRSDAGLAAALDLSSEISHHLTVFGGVRAVFAAAPSQNEFLAGLTRHAAIDWSRITAFHMDEYLGLGPDHPASFRHYLTEHLFKPAEIPAQNLHLICGEQVEQPLQVCLGYEELLKASPIDFVCAGIGENGHLAFNDPPIADFLDPVWVKVARLDEACRIQQVHDGCFANLADVPTHAYTLTIPALMSAINMSVVVPGIRKAEAVKAAIEGPISEACPASILRRHAGARIYLDTDSASLLNSLAQVP